MRVSVREGDPGYLANIAGMYFATLDGVRVPRCITADEDEGFVVTHKVDAEGHYILNAARDDAETEIRHGVVKITRINR